MKFRVYAQTVASKLIGEIEADTIEEAREKANESMVDDLHMSLCHQCAEIDLDEPDFEFEAIA